MEPSVSDGGCLSVGQRPREDSVGVIVVEDEEIVISATGLDWESVSLVGVGFGEIVAVQYQGEGFVGTGVVRFLVGGDVK